MILLPLIDTTRPGRTGNLVTLYEFGLNQERRREKMMGIYGIKKSKFWSKIKIMVKHLNFGQK